MKKNIKIVTLKIFMYSMMFVLAILASLNRSLFDISDIIFYFIIIGGILYIPIGIILSYAEKQKERTTDQTLLNSFTHFKKQFIEKCNLFTIILILSIFLLSVLGFYTFLKITDYYLIDKTFLSVLFLISILSIPIILIARHEVQLHIEKKNNSENREDLNER